jgi:hypothetical protein
MKNFSIEFVFVELEANWIVKTAPILGLVYINKRLFDTKPLIDQRAILHHEAVHAIWQATGGPRIADGEKL